jgi:hypothetical protein
MRLIEGSDRRTHKLPTMEEIAAVIPIEYSDRSFRDTVLTLRSNSNLRQNTEFEQHFQRISQAHAAYMPTHYVFLFPHGTYGWHWGLQFSLSTTSISIPSATTTTIIEDHLPIRERGRLSQCVYYRFTLKTANLTSFLLAASIRLQNYQRIHNNYCQDKWYVALLHGVHFNNAVYDIGLKS